MLSIQTLLIKPDVTIQKNSGDTEDIMDLTFGSFIYSQDVQITGVGVVSTDLEMRPDLVAKIYYGDVSKLDYILKFNGISNPFSLQSGQILLIGDVTQMADNFAPDTVTNNDSTKQDIRAKFFDPNRLSKKDAQRLALLQLKSRQFANPASNLPPNMADIGSTEISVSPTGTVIFGGDVVGTSTTNCPQVISKATVLAKLLQNKIFKNS